MTGLVYAGLYRNKMRDVQSFLKEKHSATGYCVYNLCTEEHFAYKSSHFEQVANFPFDDHQVGSHLVDSPSRGTSLKQGAKQGTVYSFTCPSYRHPSLRSTLLETHA